MELAEAVASMMFFWFVCRLDIVVEYLQLAGNPLQSTHGRMASKHWHFVDFRHCGENHATVLSSLGQIELEPLILNIAQLTGHCGDGDEYNLQK